MQILILNDLRFLSLSTLLVHLLPFLTKDFGSGFSGSFPKVLVASGGVTGFSCPKFDPSNLVFPCKPNVDAVGCVLGSCVEVYLFGFMG